MHGRAGVRRDPVARNAVCTPQFRWARTVCSQRSTPYQPGAAAPRRGAGRTAPAASTANRSRSSSGQPPSEAATKLAPKTSPAPVASSDVDGQRRDLGVLAGRLSTANAPSPPRVITATGTRFGEHAQRRDRGCRCGCRPCLGLVREEGVAQGELVETAARPLLGRVPADVREDLRAGRGGLGEPRAARPRGGRARSAPAAGRPSARPASTAVPGRG